MAHSVIALAIGTMLAATPALAKSNADEAVAKKQVATDKTKYCVKIDDMTGSRLSKQECFTKKEWAAQGIDIEAELKNGKK